MKKLIVALISISLFIACDKVKHPDQKPPVIPHCVDTLTQIVKTNTLTSNSRKVLVEDYTGHQCINCPRAAEAAESLTATYGSSVVVIANHVSKTFAAPYNDTVYKEDFRNPASDEWDLPANFSMSGAGLPKGMINRQTPYAQSPSAWSSIVPIALAKPQSAKLDITSYYDPLSHYANVKIKTTFKTAWPNSVNITVLYTQDSIISDQKDGSPPAGATMDPTIAARRLNYRFDNIVLGSFNGAWGDLVKAGPVAANDTLTISYGCYLVSKTFYNKPAKPAVYANDKYVSVVAFVYDVATKEILQVEKLKIR